MHQHEWLIERQQLLERIKELEAENAELRKRIGLREMRMWLIMHYRNSMTLCDRKGETETKCFRIVFAKLKISNLTSLQVADYHRGPDRA